MTGDHSLLSSTYNADGLSVVVFTVAMDYKTVDLLKETVARKHWNVTYSNHKDYISSSRRPASGLGLRTSTLCVALVNFDDSIEQASEAALYLSQTYAGHITVVALGTSLNPDLMLAAMRSGCREFLLDPDSDALPELLDRLEMRWMRTERVDEAPLGSILSLFGAKGGVGTTTLAVHLAMFLVQCHNKRTLLIDHHSQLGHVCVYLGMDGSRCHFSEVVQNVNRLDSELLGGFVGHHPSGLDVLSSPDVGESGVPLNAEAVSRTLAFLRSEYDYVVVDSTPPLDAAGIAALEASSKLFVVVTPEIGAVRDLSRYIDKIALVDAFAEKLKVVLNRSGSQHAIHVDQIEKAIKLPIPVRVPDCYPDLVRSENLGEPISPYAKSDMARAVTNWADSIVGSPSRITTTSTKTGPLSWLRQGLPPRVAVNRAQ